MEFFIKYISKADNILYFLLDFANFFRMAFL